jgi:hypothetical protein
MARSALTLTPAEARIIVRLRHLPKPSQRVIHRVIAESERVHARGSNPVKD